MMYRFGQEEIDAIAGVINSKKLFRYIEGDHSEAAHFEREFAARLDSAHAVLMSSGTAALICGLAAMGIGPGDEVVVPGYTFVATALAPLAVGAVPVLCEIDESLTIDPRELERLIGDKTRAIIPVHMNGFPCNMDAIGAVADKHNLVVLEDACQAIGGRYRDRHLGTLGQMGAFSFNQFKILTAGEGGAVITQDGNLYERAFIQHDGSCGISPYNGRFEEPLFAGWAFRASEITATILRVQLQKLDDILSALRATKQQITMTLAEVPCLAQAPCHDPQGECATHAAYQFPSAGEAERFCGVAAEAGLDAYLAGYSWHVYSDWDLIFQGRGGHHPAQNPLRRTNRKYDPNQCPKTLDVLSRTVLLPCDPEITSDSLARLVDLTEKSLV